LYNRQQQTTQGSHCGTTKPRKGASIMDAILEYLTLAWEWLSEFFQTLDLQSIWDTLSGLLG